MRCLVDLRTSKLPHFGFRVWQKGSPEPTVHQEEQMSALEIVIAAVVVVAILFALLMFVPRMRERARLRAHATELDQRRTQAIAEQRHEADLRARHAEEAQRRARIADAEASRERAEAQLRREQAAQYERGMADHELIEDSESERFAGTSATGGSPTMQSADTTSSMTGRPRGREQRRVNWSAA